MINWEAFFVPFCLTEKVKLFIRTPLHNPRLIVQPKAPLCHFAYRWRECVYVCDVINPQKLNMHFLLTFWSRQEDDRRLRLVLICFLSFRLAGQAVNLNGFVFDTFFAEYIILFMAAKS